MTIGGSGAASTDRVSCSAVASSTTPLYSNKCANHRGVVWDVATEAP
jgi:hypothetical protein